MLVSDALVLERIANLIRSESRRLAAEHSLSVAQLELLAFLSRANRYTDTVIAAAEYFGATKGTMSQSVHALVQKGLVHKQPDETDRRRIHLKLTGEGRKIVKATHPPPLLEAALRSVETTTSWVELLAALQRAHEGKTFGVCRTCEHFQTQGRSHRCGLTGERLTKVDSALICREHTVP